MRLQKLIWILVLLFIAGFAGAAEIVQTSRYAYRLTLPTTADKAIVWQLWEDVENWKDYDRVLEYSYLKDGSAFTLGAIGYVKAKGAPKTKFELVAVDPGHSFIESLKLPLWSTLELKRYVATNGDEETLFTHEVEFKGRLRGLYYRLLANRFKKELHLVMGRLQALAELKQAEQDAKRH